MFLQRPLSQAIIAYCIVEVQYFEVLEQKAVRAAAAGVAAVGAAAD